MCCCGKPTINGEMGYRWNEPNGPAGVHPVNPPELGEKDVLVYDEPGRCGGLDSHSHHFRVVSHSGTLELLVRHGGGDERIYLSCGKTLLGPLAALDSNGRYWMLAALAYAHSRAKDEARNAEKGRWAAAAANKRIKTRKSRGGSVRVWIESGKDELCYSL